MSDWEGRPADLYLSIRDPDDRPLRHARALVRGRGARTDARGDVQLRQIEVGVAVLEARADGFAPAVRRVTLGEGDLVRETIRLQPVSRTRQPFGRPIRTESAGPLRLEAEAGALIPVVRRGADRVEIGLATWPFDALQDAGAPASPLMQDGDGAPVALQLAHAFRVEGADDQGGATRVREGRTLRVSARLASPASLDLHALDLYHLDEHTGTWVPRDNLELEFRPDAGGDRWFTAQIDGLGTWALARRAETGCVRAQPDTCPGARSLGAEVELVGPGLHQRRARTATRDAPEFSDLSPGTYIARAWREGHLLATQAITVSGGETCEELRLAAQSCSGLAVALTSPAACPVGEVEVEVLRLDGRLVANASAPQGTVHLPDVAAGTYVVRAHDARGASARGLAVVPSEGPGVARLTLVGGRELPPPGGCAEVPCWGDRCDACLVVEMRNADDAPVPGVDIDLCGPAEQSASSDAQGDVCFDVEAGDRGRAILLGPSGPMGVELDAEGSCDAPGACAAVTTWLEDGPPGWDEVPLTAARLGWAEPSDALAVGASRRWTRSGGDVELTLTGEGASMLPPSLTCEGDALAARLLDLDPTGQVREAGWIARCDDIGGWSVLLELRWNGAASSVGARPADEVLHELTLNLRSPDGRELPLTLSRGSLDLLARGAGQLSLGLDLWLVRGDTTATRGPVRMQGALAFTLLDAADAPDGDEGLHLTAIIGALATTHDLATHEEERFGPSGGGGGGWTGNTGTELPPESFSAAPRLGPFFQLGGLRLDALRATTPELSLDADGALSASAGSPESGAVIGPWLIWLDRAVAQHLYQIAGANPSGIDAGATILGVVASVDPATGALTRSQGLRRATLTDATGATRDAVLLDERLRVCAPSSARWFLFTGVSEATPEEPLRLELIDASGAPVPAYDMLLYPSPGSALVLGLAASDP